MENYLKGVKPLTVAHVIIPHKKININKRLVTEGFEQTSTCKRSTLTSISRRQKRKFKIEKTIDLHGHTKEEAFMALIKFFNICQKEGVRKALVITGGNNLRETTLRKHFKIWIQENFGNYVASCTSANIWHGGQGAFYLTIKHHFCP